MLPYEKEFPADYIGLWVFLSRFFTIIILDACIFKGQ